jgi:cadmium resistance protein CadD (predicted permease)
MATLPGAIADAAALFAGTNVDDLVVLAVLSAFSGSR